MIRVLGLDLSLTSTGWALLPDGTHGTIRTPHRGPERLIAIRGAVAALLADGVDVVVIEHYAFGRPNQACALGELGGVIRVLLVESRVPYVEMPPSSMKKVATGKGNAGKEEVFAAAIKSLGYDGHSFDEADAMWLAECAFLAYGVRLATRVQEETLRRCVWPTVEAWTVPA